jgi:hypothetical protein
LRPWTPLALTLALHLLLVLAWLGGARGDPAHRLANKLPDAPPRASVFVPVRPPPLPRSEPEPEPKPAVAQPTLRRLHPPPPPAVPRPMPAAIPDATPDATPAATPAPAIAAPSPDARMGIGPQAGPAPALPGEPLASSKAMAGRVDRELRKGAPPIMAEPERKWERFAEAFAAALDSYTAPDGVIVYRKTVGGRVSCYRSGSVGGLVNPFFGSADGHGAGNTSCPSGVSWTRR